MKLSEIIGALILLVTLSMGLAMGYSIGKNSKAQTPTVHTMRPQIESQRAYSEGYQAGHKAGWTACQDQF